jgi:hypothetical protein
MSLSLNQHCTKDTTRLLITSAVMSVLAVQLRWHMSLAKRTVAMALQNVWLDLRSISLLRVFCFDQLEIYMVRRADAISNCLIGLIVPTVTFATYVGVHSYAEGAQSCVGL